MARPRNARSSFGSDEGLRAFLNVPYDHRFQDLFLAYVAGLAAHGVRPEATVAIPGGVRRLDRIFELIQACRFSFHDLSRVELDESTPPTPRFNMPFELGLAVAWERMHPAKHTWFVFESENRRVLKSLSDLAGTDVHVHSNDPNRVFREICNAFDEFAQNGERRDQFVTRTGVRAAPFALLSTSADSQQYTR